MVYTWVALTLINVHLAVRPLVAWKKQIRLLNAFKMFMGA